MYFTQILSYNRNEAIAYSNKWALTKNPNYYDFTDIGGDCTNFVSQCIYAGSRIMNYDKYTGWYYINANNKAPAWTGVNYLYTFLTGNNGPGPFGENTDITNMEPGDIIQLGFNEIPNDFGHSLFIVSCGFPPDINNIYVNTHTDEQLNYSLTGFEWTKIRFIKILGVKA